MSESREYKVVNGTYYDVRTPQAVIDVLEHSRKTHKRIVIIYGNVDTLEPEGSATPYRGHVSRSGGSKSIPILIRTARSLGGEEIDSHLIIEIRESRGGRVLYRRQKNDCIQVDYKDYDERWHSVL